MPAPHEQTTSEWEAPNLAGAVTPTGLARPKVSVRAQVAAASHTGLHRANNEDHFIVARLGRSLEVLATNLPEGRVPSRYEEAGYALAVADGMGGAAAGEVASALALSIGTRLALDESVWHLRLDAREARALVDRVTQYFHEIDRLVSEQAQSKPGLAGMGTTLTVGYSVGPDLFIFHVGDSRAYLLRQGQLRQLTRDQTLAQELADAGHLPQDMAASHELRHVLTQAIGTEFGEIRLAIHQLELEDGDRFLLCTDGLSDMASDRAIASALGQSPTAEAACQELVRIALEGGGRDNITVVTAFYEVSSLTAV
jgi:protein phosphatase